VLGVHRITSKGADYYLSDLAGELPISAHAHREDVAARWAGRAAEGLGLVGPIDPAQLRAVLEGRHPTAGRPLRSDRATVLGFDLTFSAPKSVSVVFALGGEEMAGQVLAAHRAGVRGALSYVEAHALSAQRGSGDRREIVPTTGLVAASFTHGVSRNLDPHLHTHVVMSNLVHGEDGRWSACDHRGISAHRNATAAVYDAHLRTELSKRLGVQWVAAPGLRAEVGGVSPLLLGEFSSRSADIRMYMAERGSHSARAARVAWAATRAGKETGLTFASLSTQWEQRARSLGGSPTDIGAVVGHARAARTEPLDEHRFAAALSLAPDGAARRRDVVAAFGAAAVGGVDAPSVDRLTELWTPRLSDRAQIGVAEDVRSLRSVVPGGHLLRALGPRPVNGDAHEVWRAAARAIDDYRHRWGIREGNDALGVDLLPSGISSLPTNRLVEHLRTSRRLEEARQRLGWPAARAHEMDRGR
jgi:conjugative relaxase-like TrwC/TraI family protein